MINMRVECRLYKSRVANSYLLVFGMFVLKTGTFKRSQCDVARVVLFETFLDENGKDGQNDNQVKHI